MRNTETAFTSHRLAITEGVVVGGARNVITALIVAATTDSGACAACATTLTRSTVAREASYARARVVLRGITSAEFGALSDVSETPIKA